MKKSTIFIGAIVGLFLMSLSYNQANERAQAYSSIVYTIPIKPKSTVIVYNITDMKSLLKKGYQLQDVCNEHAYGENLYVMVKY